MTIFIKIEVLLFNGAREVDGSMIGPEQSFITFIKINIHFINSILFE